MPLEMRLLAPFASLVLVILMAGLASRAAAQPSDGVLEWRVPPPELLRRLEDTRRALANADAALAEARADRSAPSREAFLLRILEREEDAFVADDEWTAARMDYFAWRCPEAQPTVDVHHRVAARARALRRETIPLEREEIRAEQAVDALPYEAPYRELERLRAQARAARLRRERADARWRSVSQRRRRLILRVLELCPVVIPGDGPTSTR